MTFVSTDHPTIVGIWPDYRDHTVYQTDDGDLCCDACVVTGRVPFQTLTALLLMENRVKCQGCGTWIAPLP